MIYDDGEVSGTAHVSLTEKENRYKVIKTNSTFFNLQDVFCYAVFDDRIVFTKPTIDNTEPTYKVRASSTNTDTRTITLSCNWLELGKTYNLFTHEHKGEDELTIFFNETTRYYEN